MKIENKTYYYFEGKEKALFNDFLSKKGIKSVDFAKKCGISLSLLSLVINGKKPITKRTLNIFNKNGFKLEIKL